jgi:hypothetical protein
MVVDPRQNEVLLYSVDANTSEIFLPGHPKAKKVSGAAKSQARYILKMGNKALILDAYLKGNQELDIGRDHAGHLNGLGSLYDWAAARDQIFAIGMFSDSAAVTSASKDFHLGFLEAHIGKDTASIDDAKFLMPLEDSPYYVLGHSYVAANDLSAFMLKMNAGSSAELWEFTFANGRKRRLLEKTFPAEFRRIPRIVSETDGPENSVGLYGEIEHYHLPVGIYGFEKMLYLLARSPIEGGTAWWLYQIDPGSDKLVGRLRLPTTADHVSIVPASNAWFIFEKGPVQAGGSQKIETLITIPTNWIVNPLSSPLADGSKGRTCARMEKKTA